MKRRLLSTLLFLCVLVTLFTIPVAAAGRFPDSEGHWSQDSAERWGAAGVFNGDENGNFNPENMMKRAEVAQMLANMLGYTKMPASNPFNDVPAGAWYYEAVLKLAAAGVMVGDGAGNANPEAYISRQEFAVLMCRVTGLKAGSGSSLGFADSGSVAPWAADAVTALSERGMINGVGNNMFAPGNDINRASVAKLLDNMISAYVTENGATVSGTQNGVVIIAASNVKLENASLNENVVVAPKAANATVTLAGSTTADEVIVAAEGAKVVVDTGASANAVTVEAPGAGAQVAGTVNTVTVAETASNAAVTVAKDASVTKLDVEAPNTKTEVAGTVESVNVAQSASNVTVNTSTGAKIEKVTTDAAGTKVTGASGTVSNVTADKNATGTSVSTTGTKVENNSSDTVSAGGTTVPPDSEGTVTTPSGGGGYVPPAPSHAVYVHAGDKADIIDDIVANLEKPENGATPGTSTPWRHKFAAGLGLTTQTTTTDTGCTIKLSGETTIEKLQNTKKGETNDDGYLTYVIQVTGNDGVDTIKMGSDVCALDSDKTGLDGISLVVNQKIYNGSAKSIVSTPITFTLSAGETSKGDYTVTIDASAVTIDGTKKVTFKDGDTVCDTVFLTGEATTVTTLPEAPEKANNYFAGWYTTGDDGAETKFTTDTTVSADTTVNAKWVEIKDVSAQVHTREAGHAKGLADAGIESFDYAETYEAAGMTFGTGKITVDGAKLIGFINSGLQDEEATEEISAQNKLKYISKEVESKKYVFYGVQFPKVEGAVNVYATVATSGAAASMPEIDDANKIELNTDGVNAFGKCFVDYINTAKYEKAADSKKITIDLGKASSTRSYYLIYTDNDGNVVAVQTADVTRELKTGSDSTPVGTKLNVIGYDCEPSKQDGAPVYVTCVLLKEGTAIAENKDNVFKLSNSLIKLAVKVEKQGENYVAVIADTTSWTEWNGENSDWWNLHNTGLTCSIKEGGERIEYWQFITEDDEGYYAGIRIPGSDDLSMLNGLILNPVSGWGEKGTPTEDAIYSSN